MDSMPQHPARLATCPRQTATRITRIPSAQSRHSAPVHRQPLPKRLALIIQQPMTLCLSSESQLLAPPPSMLAPILHPHQLPHILPQPSIVLLAFSVPRRRFPLAHVFPCACVPAPRTGARPLRIPPHVLRIYLPPAILTSRFAVRSS